MEEIIARKFQVLEQEWNERQRLSERETFVHHGGRRRE